MRTIVSSVEVDVTAEAAYASWADIEALPGFMSGVRNVRRLDERTSNWVVMVNRERREFGAVVTQDVPGARLAWEGRGTPRHRGAVDFRPLGDNRAKVSVELDWEPEGLFDRVGDRLGMVRRQVGRDLEAFRHHLGQATAGQGDGADKGRSARSPTEIPARGWIDVVKRTAAELRADNVPVVAAGVAFFFFLALVPALLAVVSVYGLVAEPADVRDQLASYLTAAPTDARELVLDQVENITTQPRAGLGVGVAVSVALALVSASKGAVSLVAALNIAYDEEETRKFLRLRLLALSITLGMTLAAVGGVGGMVLVGNLADRLGTVGEVAVGVLRWPVLGTLVVLGLAALYRYAPNRDNAQWRWVTPGALLAAVLWLVGSALFSLYLSAFGDLQKTYGSLAAVAALLLWLQLTAYVIVFGAEFDAEAERQTAADSTVGSSRPLGARRAYAADTVAGGE